MKQGQKGVLQQVIGMFIGPGKTNKPPGHAESPTWVDIKHEKDNTLPTVEHRVKFEEKRVALQSKNDGTWAFSDL